MFRAVYDSPWHVPGVVLLVGALVLIAVVPRRGFLARWAGLFALEIMLDGYVTGALSPLLPAHAAWLGTVAVPFVILGDLRYFMLVERFTRIGAAPSDADAARTPPAAWYAALAWSFLVPVGAFGASRVYPAPFANVRHLFLVYEVAFVLLALVYRARVVGPRTRGAAVSPAVARWLRGLTRFELIQYTAWALADVVILSGRDLGFGLRLVPNVMYYAAFVPFALLTAPREARR